MVEANRNGNKAMRAPLGFDTATRFRRGLAGLMIFGVMFVTAVSAEPVGGGASSGAVVIDLSMVVPDDRYQAELFGVNWNWLEGGGGLVEYGELLRDRSFRNQDDARKRAWVETPEKSVGGRIKLVDSGGVAIGRGGRSYPGYMRLSQQGTGYTCISQQLVEAATADAKYLLRMHARRESGKPAISAFLADAGLMPIEETDNVSWVDTDKWREYEFTLTPSKAQAGPYLRVCLVSTGEMSVDEIRLQRLGGSPRVKRGAADRIRELGVRSLRWPTGSDADRFDWREAIGPLADRGEIPSAFDVFETPSLGLHEFLDFCEASGIVPLITGNVLLPPETGADLVEYILGPTSTAFGALRARHGRPAPWNVRHFELGNEPTELYRGDFDKSDAAKGYLKQAAAMAVAMRSRAQSLGKTIELKGVVETTFTLADWIKLVPMLARWNDIVLDPSSPLRSLADQWKGNFYSAFTWSSSERELFEEVMAGGTTIVATADRIQKKLGKATPFWLTEYGVMVQKHRLFGGAEILLERAKDFQAGLSDADILMSAMQSRFGGAYLFNLSQWGTWGMLRNSVDFRPRPAGLAFSLLSPFAGEVRVPVRVEGGATVMLTGGKGNNPARTQYRTLAVVGGSMGRGALQLAILNRSYDRSEKLKIEVRGRQVASADLQQLGPERLDAGNDDKPDNVVIRRRSLSGNELGLLDIPPRSLSRIVFTLR